MVCVGKWNATHIADATYNPVEELTGNEPIYIDKSRLTYLVIAFKICLRSTGISDANAEIAKIAIRYC